MMVQQSRPLQTPILRKSIRTDPYLQLSGSFPYSNSIGIGLVHIEFGHIMVQQNIKGSVFETEIQPLIAFLLSCFLIGLIENLLLRRHGTPFLFLLAVQEPEILSLDDESGH